MSFLDYFQQITARNVHDGAARGPEGYTSSPLRQPTSLDNLDGFDGYYVLGVIGVPSLLLLDLWDSPRHATGLSKEGRLYRSNMPSSVFLFQRQDLYEAEKQEEGRHDRIAS